MERALKDVKIRHPFVWDGRLDIETFITWTYQVNTCIELNGFE
jgi:hypothetical protein